MAKLTDINIKDLSKKIDDISEKVDKIEEIVKEEVSEVKEEKVEPEKEIKEEKTEKSKMVNSKNPFTSEECVDILNYRIEQEEQSSRLYEAMSLWLNDNGFVGAAKRWKQDSKDELEHAGWAKEFLLAMGIQPKLPALKEPVQEFKGLADIIEQSYEHEILVTQQCNDLAKHAMEYGNHLLYQLAIKYLKEQQEELEVAQDRLDRLKMAGDDKIAIMLFDQELGNF